MPAVLNPVSTNELPTSTTPSIAASPESSARFLDSLKCLARQSVVELQLARSSEASGKAVAQVLEAFQHQQILRSSLNEARFSPLLAHPERLADFVPDINLLALTDNTFVSGLNEAACGEHHHHHHDHDHDDGAIVIDLDEAVHGAYATTKYISQVAEGNPQAVVESFKQEAFALADSPIAYLGKGLAESGVGEFCAAVGTGALMLPLAAMAMKAGIEEVHHARHSLKESKHNRGALRRSLQQVQTAVSIHNAPELRARLTFMRSQLKDNAFARKLHKADFKIGIASAASGATIGLKALSDISLKVSLGVKGALSGKGFFELGEALEGSAAAAGATVGLGIAGTLVLGPLAGAAATTLGAYFTMKSLAKKRQLKQDFQLLQADHKHAYQSKRVDGTWTESHQKLMSFIDRQGAKRIRFFERFARWNKAFLVGSGLYGASALTKAAIVLAVIGGAAAVSNPVGLAVIAGVGIVGAVGMGVASLSFIHGHGKQSKYTKHTSADHDLVDRHFLATLHQTRLGKGGDLLGFELAANCLQHLDARKDGLRQLLHDAAQSAHKLSPHSKQLSFAARLSGKCLKEKELQHYLSTPDGQASLIKLVAKDLEAREVYLHSKLQAHSLLQKGAADTTVTPASTSLSGVGLTALNALTQELGGMDAEYEKTQAELEVVLTLRQQCQADIDNTKVTALLRYWGADHADQPDSLAEHLLKDMDKDLRLARGVLFESQLQGARLGKSQFEDWKVNPTDLGVTTNLTCPLPTC